MYLRNHSTFLPLILSVASVFLNLMYHWNAIFRDMGITMGLMMYILFGIFWCMGFAMLMGPAFWGAAVVLRITFDIIPALGTSLWSILTTLLIVAVIRDDKTPGFLKNLPLFSLIYANVMNVRSEFQGDPHSDFGRFVYQFANGTTHLGFSPSSYASWYGLHSFSETSVTAFNALHDNAIDYINGRNLSSFLTHFHNWETGAQQFRFHLYGIRLLCIVGFIVEAMGIVIVITMMGVYFPFAGWARSTRLSPSRGVAGSNECPAPPGRVSGRQTRMDGSIPSAFKLGRFQIAVCLLLIGCSHYLWAMIRVQKMFTSDAEHEAWMLLKSRTSKYNKCDVVFFTSRGQTVWGSSRKKNVISVKTLPALGIVRDIEESKRSGRIVLRSEVNQVQFVLTFVEKDVYAAQLYNLGDEGEELSCLDPSHESAELREEAMVTQ